MRSPLTAEVAGECARRVALYRSEMKEPQLRRPYCPPVRREPTLSVTPEKGDGGAVMEH